MTAITIVGHRGARGEAPENTLPGFTRARELGLTEVELDVRLSADDELVVLHDKTLARTTGIDGSSREHSMLALANMDARLSLPRWPKKTGVPSLDAVVSVGAPELRYQFEVKSDSRTLLKKIAQQLGEFIDQRQMHERVVVTSSHRYFLGLMGEQHPELSRGLVCRYAHLQPLRRAQELGVDWLILHYKLITPELMARIQQEGVKLSVWTVNDLAIADRLVEMGVDSLITDYPSAFSHHFNLLHTD